MTSSCEPLLDATFPCLPTTFVGWTSLAYILLPLNITIYDLEQLYLFNCNFFRYHPPFSNSFQTGIYSYILCVLSIIHAFASFECHGCPSSFYICHIDIIALYCIYFMLIMFSWTRLFSQYKINRYYQIPTPDTSSPLSLSRIKAVQNAKLIHTILFSSTYHWISTIFALLIAIALGVFATFYVPQHIQLYISGAIYGFSYLSLFLCEFLIRKVLMIEPDHVQCDAVHKANISINVNIANKSSPRSLRLSSTGSDRQKDLTLGLFDVQTENKKAIFSLLFIIIAGCGYLIDILQIDKTCMNIGHGIYHIFSAIALTFWYWSLVGETWTFKTEHISSSYTSKLEVVQQHHKNLSSPVSVGSGDSMVTDTSLRNHIINIHSSSNGTYSNGHDIRDSVLMSGGVELISPDLRQNSHDQDSVDHQLNINNSYKTKPGKKRSSFFD